MWLQHSDDPHFLHRAKMPQFLVILPPKTGSTWLADNLRCHHQLYLPALKEVKYFSSFYKWLDLDWYASHFAPAGDRIAGEASPSYAILSIEQIRTIRRLLPELKLIYLMRDPVSRSWSHAKHANKYREANFAQARTDYAEATDAQWVENFSHLWSLTNGDYLGQLQRWSSVFPREQMYVGFYESIEARPAELLREVLAFLEVDTNVDLSKFPLFERIFEGTPGEMPPHLETTLHRLLHSLTAETVEFLRQRFGLTPPHDWQRTLCPPKEPLDGPTPELFRPDAKTADLPRVLALEDQFQSSYRQILLGFRGYDIVFDRGRLIAIPQRIGPRPFPATGEVDLSQLISEGMCLTASTVAELKEQVTDRVIAGQEARLLSTATELQTTQIDVQHLHAEFGKLHTAIEENRRKTACKLAELVAAVAELQRPTRLRLMARRIKRAVHRLMSWLRLDSSPQEV